MNTAKARMIRPYRPMPCSKAARVRVAPSSPLDHWPVETMTRQVMLHTTKVSTKTSKIPMSPCFTGWSTWAVAWIMGAEPQPASLLNTERESPTLMAWVTVAPRKPPKAAVPVKAVWKIRAKAPGRAEALCTRMNSPPAM